MQHYIGTLFVLLVCSINLFIIYHALFIYEFQLSKAIIYFPERKQNFSLNIIQLQGIQFQYSIS